MTDSASSKTSLISRAKTWARSVKRDVVTVYFAARDPLAPMGARILAAVVAAYALSPIDLIPDFIPVLGYLDDLILVPALVWLALKLIPAEVMNHSREQAVEWINSNQSKPKSYVGLFIVVAIWLICLVFALKLLGVWI